jgi:hypothetical protein
MTGKRNIVGFLATGSGVKEYQLSLRGCFVPRRRRPTAKPAQFASLLRSRFPESCEVPVGITRRREWDGSRATRIGDTQDHARPTSRRGFARQFGGLNMKRFSLRRTGSQTAGVLLLALFSFRPIPYAQTSKMRATVGRT